MTPTTKKKIENIMSKYFLRDLFNDRIISAHRTIAAAVRAQIRHASAVRKANGQSSYLPTSIQASDGSDISEQVCVVR
jgi:hypothetical protein